MEGELTIWRLWPNANLTSAKLIRDVARSHA